ncbi:hypothetical protein MACH26_09570 [Planctobacterium marinum]|uniref:Na(+)-translocating NADH-quinone reductase subunit E n=1 Tax=Planctobacterium marinum TaxID=1631968 RepID=A0AA48HFI2_9ALTE|nr:hypothetical protein MACH26_09570 [Planctobacterium marinum]
MSTFLLAFVFFLVVVAAMAIGYILQNKTISGSCGGLGALGIEKACDCPEPCDRKKAKLEREQARQKKFRNGKTTKLSDCYLRNWISNRVLLLNTPTTLGRKAA